MTKWVPPKVTVPERIHQWAALVPKFGDWHGLCLDDYTNDASIRRMIQAALDLGLELSDPDYLLLRQADQAFIEMSVPRPPPIGFETPYDFWELMIPAAVAREPNVEEDFACYRTYWDGFSRSDLLEEFGCAQPAATVAVDVLTERKEARNNDYWTRSAWYSGRRSPLTVDAEGQARISGDGRVVTAYVTVPTPDGGVVGCAMYGVLEPEADALLAAEQIQDEGVEAPGQLERAFASARTALARRGGLRTGRGDERWKPTVPGMPIPPGWE